MSPTSSRTADCSAERLLGELRPGAGEKGLGAVDPDELEVRVGREAHRRSGKVSRPVPQASSSIRRGARRSTRRCQNGRSKCGSSAISSSKSSGSSQGDSLMGRWAGARQRQRRGRLLARGLRPQRSEVGSHDQDDDDQQQPRKEEHRLDPERGDQDARAHEGEHEGGRRAGLVQREQPPVQRLGHRVGQQQPVVHEREAVAEAAERERREHEPEEGGDGAQDQVGGHADEPEHVGLAPLPGRAGARTEGRAEERPDPGGGHQRGEAGAADAEQLTGEQDLADIDHPDGDHGHRRGGQQHLHARPRGDLTRAGAQGGQQRRARALDRRVQRDRREQDRGDRERAGVDGHQRLRVEGDQQRARDRRPEREPDVVERRVEAHRGRAVLRLCDLRKGRQGGRVEQRAADAGDERAGDHQAERGHERERAERGRGAARRPPRGRSAAAADRPGRPGAGRARRRAAARRAGRRSAPTGCGSARRPAAAGRRSRSRCRCSTARGR